MADDDTISSQNSGSQLKIFLIFLVISILLAGVIGILVFRYFNRESIFNLAGQNNTEKPLATVETGEDPNANKDTDLTPEPTKVEPDFVGFGGVGFNMGEAPTTTPTPTPTPVPTVTPTPTPSPVNNTQTTNTKDNTTSKRVWVANDYKPGEITGDTHYVIWGDTLWEISEGKYGKGTVWRKIADANKVDYLWNGAPLIYEGTTLTLPK